jgi:3-dehydroquinate synthase
MCHSENRLALILYNVSISQKLSYDNRFYKKYKIFINLYLSGAQYDQAIFSKGDECPRYIPYLRAANSSPIPQECDIVIIRSIIIRNATKGKGSCMDILNVSHRLGSYNIFIDDNTLPALKDYLAETYKGRMAAIITDDTVGPLYQQIVSSTVASSGLSCSSMCIRHGEESKSISVLQQVYTWLCSLGMTRSDLIIALGGGVVGDLAGFAASTFMRGLPFINIPTSLLAQVDSSIGGKVAVNLPLGKNLVGAFYQPKAVFICTDFLKTLEPRYLHDGLAEVIKYGCIRDSSIISVLSNTMCRDSLLNNIRELILKCLYIKKELVEKDELDTGDRMLLNFGHTIGHGIEKHYGYSMYTHGEAVGLGMVWITEKSEELGQTEPGTARQISSLLDALSLPARPDKTIRDSIIGTIAHDKKASGDRMHVVLLRKIGEGFIKEIPMSDIGRYI